MSEDIIQTMLWHSHNADGSERIEHCCGCWNVVYADDGLYLRCNECGEKRDLMPLVDPDGTAMTLVETPRMASVTGPVTPASKS